MKINAELIGINNNIIKLKANDLINFEHLRLIENNEKLVVDVTVHDNRGITGEQNKLSHALIGDISKFSGDEPEHIESVLKYYYKAKTGNKFSHSEATKEDANNFINFLIDFVLKNDVPLPKRYTYLTQNNYFFYACLKNRKCCICGCHADIAHVESVGSGRNRKQIDHTKHHFMSLCRKHHQEQHSIGINYFISKYKILTVKLTYQDVIDLKLMTKKQVEEIKSND
ncbi:putative HNHc nuclease [Vagococcus entomophilus]|uniref:Phage protein n=1 Tax=Vagococcus entomophilus TaxID=1160095 RepID=A0A430AK52_9ENTE|nr:putative HNHc nuclease [Vagococcus entomophilus]RSU08465.1 hypothetical protein CBF30_04290 [Vagococcus entomophilus]